MVQTRPKIGETREQALARRREYWHANRERLTAIKRQKWNENKDELNSKRNANNALNREAVRANRRESYKRNAIQRRLDSLKNHKKRKLRIPSWSETEKIKEFYQNCPEGYEVDHIYPLLGKTVSGLHVLANLQYLTREENRAKRNFMPCTFTSQPCIPTTTVLDRLVTRN